MSATSETPVTERQILLLGPYDVLGTGVIDAVAENPKWGIIAAEILADNGIHVVVIEQNKRPYGKIEDGLPRWHLEQRKQEYSRIDARLRKPVFSSFPTLGLAATWTIRIF